MNDATRFRLHHTGLLVTDIAAAASGLLERFGYRSASAVIEDPLQTAQVQFLHLPGTGHWLELVAPNSKQSKLSNALRKGGGLHHLCYEVTAIEAACSHLREQAMLLLSHPAPAVAFGGRRIAWFMDRTGLLIELVEAGAGPLTLDSLNSLDSMVGATK